MSTIRLAIHSLAVSTTCLLFGLFVGLSSCSRRSPISELTAPCTDTWFQEVEATVKVIDDDGHGPDIGSQEWMSAVEFKLGMRGNTSIPKAGTLNWCQHINDAIIAR